LTMRQAHPAGERMFVDYAGQTVDLIDGRTGEIRAAQIFVAAMGASNYTYAEASWTQTLPDWIGAHVRVLAFMGGVPAQLVPDNPKVGVTRANWYEPGLNRTYLDLATHYGTAILPARPRRPRDKAKVEVAVLVVERWILARLRNRRFFSLAELNQAIAELVVDLNARPMRRLGVSRRDLFLELDCPALKELPAEPYEYAQWRVRRVGLDWGLEPLGPEQRHDILEIVEERYGRGATLITSQIPVDRWHDLIGEPTLADAILDRIIHNAHRLQLKGDSLRKQRGPKTAAA